MATKQTVTTKQRKYGRFYTKPTGVQKQDVMLSKNISDIEDWFIIDPFVGAGALEQGLLSYNEGLLTDVDANAVSITSTLFNSDIYNYTIIDDSVNFLDKSITSWIDELKYKHNYNLLDKVKGKKVLILANPPFGRASSGKMDEKQTIDKSCKKYGGDDLVVTSIVQMYNLAKAIETIAIDVYIATYSPLKILLFKPKTRRFSTFLEEQTELIETIPLPGSDFNNIASTVLIFSLFKIKNANITQINNIDMMDFKIRPLDVDKWNIWTKGNNNSYLTNTILSEKNKYKFVDSIYIGIDAPYHNYNFKSLRSIVYLASGKSSTDVNFLHPEALHDNIPKSIIPSTTMDYIDLKDFKIKPLDNDQLHTWGEGIGNAYIKSYPITHNESRDPNHPNDKTKSKYDGSIYFGKHSGYKDYNLASLRTIAYLSSKTPVKAHVNHLHPEILHNNIPAEIESYPTELLVVGFHLAQTILSATNRVPIWFDNAGSLLTPTLSSWNDNVMQSCALAYFYELYIEQGEFDPDVPNTSQMDWCKGKIQYIRNRFNDEIKLSFGYRDYKGNKIDYAKPVEHLISSWCPKTLTNSDGLTVKRNNLWNIIKQMGVSDPSRVPMTHYIEYDTYILDTLKEAVFSTGIFDYMWQYRK